MRIFGKKYRLVRALAFAAACVCVIVFLVCRMRKKREAGEEK